MSGVSRSSKLSESSHTGRSWAEEPYRILFPLGILCGVQGIGHWLFYGLGWIPSYSSHLHASIQTQAYMLCFIAGFLMTAMPRMSGTPAARGFETGGMIAGLTVMLACLYAGFWAAAEACYSLLLLGLFAFAVVRIRRKTAGPSAQPPAEFVWVPCALFMGLAGAFLLMAARAHGVPAKVFPVGKLLVQQGFLLGIVLGVGGFLGPRLMGTFEPVKADADAARRTKEKMKRALQGAGLLAASLVLEGCGFSRTGLGLRALVVTFVLLHTRSLVRRPVAQEPFVRYLWLSFWLVAAGNILPVFAPDYRLALMHLNFLGGYSLMTFAVGTMVILSHAGQAARLKRRWLPLDLTAAGVLTAMLLRIAGVFFPEAYFKLLALASGIWIAAALLWLVSMAPYLAQGADAASLERMHEEAKKRILQQIERKADGGSQTGCSSGS